jgi:hypothetical protein
MYSRDLDWWHDALFDAAARLEGGVLWGVRDYRLIGHRRVGVNVSWLYGRRVLCVGTYVPQEVRFRIGLIIGERGVSDFMKAFKACYNRMKEIVLCLGRPSNSNY